MTLKFNTAAQMCFVWRGTGMIMKRQAKLIKKKETILSGPFSSIQLQWPRRLILLALLPNYLLSLISCRVSTGSKKLKA